MDHPDYGEFWRRQDWVQQLHSSPVPNLNVDGFWDQEDPWGPWFHGEWQKPKAENIGTYNYDGHDTALEFRRDIEAPFFRYFLHGEGERPTRRVKTFESGSNTWHTYDKWTPAGESSGE